MSEGKPSTAFVAYLNEKLPLVERALEQAVATPLCNGDALETTSSATSAHAHNAADEPKTLDQHAGSAQNPEQRAVGSNTLGLRATGPVLDLDRYLYAPLARFTASGGKRVRPVLALLGSEAVGGTAEQAVSAAVAVELFQSAALVHDDIADESELRRGEPCVHRTEGVGVAINIGDLALTRVFEVVLADPTLPAERKVRVLNELARMERHTLEGQALDLGWARDDRWDITPADYLYMVEGKTAWYSAASPLYLGALAADADEATACGLIEVGMHAGIAFQIQDDLLNLIGDAEAQGKDFRSDITEGKRTLAVVTALHGLDEAGRAELIALLRSATKDAHELARAVELIEAGGGIAQCQNLAHEEMAAAQGSALQLVQEGRITKQAGDLLCSMASFFVNRSA